MATPVQTVMLALELARQGKPEQGAAHLRRHVAKNPGDLMATAALGQLLMQCGQMEPALFQFEKCVKAAPQAPANHNNYGMVLVQIGRVKDGLAEFRESVRLDPTYATGWVGVSMALLSDGDFKAAAEAARRAIELKPGVGESHQNLGLALLESGQVEEAIKVLRHGLEVAPGYAPSWSTLLIALNLRDTMTPQGLRAAHEEYARLTTPTPGTVPARTDPSPDRRLRVGVLSADLRQHSVMYFFESLLEHRDRAAFEYILFPTNRTRDATTVRLKGYASGFFDASAPDPGVVSRIIREQRIDIIMELGGHTAGNRLAALVDRPAPIAVTAIGYPNTTGMPQVDYRVVDSLTDPPGSESHATEKLLRIDPCFLCYRPPSPTEAPEVGPPPCAAGGPVTFGSFNSMQKLSPEAMRAWGRVLEAVPGSRLVIKSGGVYNDWAREKLFDRFAAAGVTADRVELIRPTKGTAEHLALYARMDIALDSFPYNGTTTTCEAMWMGVPVVVLAGDRHASRVGVSLMSAVGTPELVAATEAEYVRIAVDLAANRTRLASLRSGLRDRIRRSVLCDGPAYARRFEAALRAAWRQWCAGQQR